MCLGRRDKKRSKEKLLRTVEEIHTVMTDRFGPKVGTEKSDIDKLLAGVNKLNDILVSRGLQSATLTKPGSINLNIILDQGKNSNPILNDVALKSENIQRDENKNFHEPKQEFGKKNIELHENTQSIPTANSTTSSRLSDDRNDEASIANHKMQRQLDGILNLMKEGIKNGKLNFTINGKTVVTRTTEHRESVEHLLETDSGSDRFQCMIDCVDSQGIMNPACSPIHSLSKREADDTRHSSLDLYMSDDVIVHTPIQSPRLLTADQTSINSERLSTRYEGSSFLSTSSTEGNTTCDENGFSSSQMSVVSNSNNADQRLSPNQEPNQTKTKQNQTKKSHRRLQPPKTLFLCPAGSNHGESSESDVGSHEIKTNVRKEVQGNHQGFVCDDDFSTSSQGTDITDQSYDDDSQISGVGHYASTDIRVPELSCSTSPDRDNFVQVSNALMLPRVRWADTASEPGSTPFLNIREISASPSDHFSGDTQQESDTASGEEEQSGSESNTGQQNDVCD
jgi:hypothetical protein